MDLRVYKGGTVARKVLQGGHMPLVPPHSYTYAEEDTLHRVYTTEQFWNSSQRMF